MRRVYLDHNATTPLLPQARAAMMEAMDVLGNPSSVHAEGRAALGIVQKARRQVADAFGVGQHDIIWTSGATEAAALALSGRGLKGADVEHDAVGAWIEAGADVRPDGVVAPSGIDVLQWANPETGVVQPDMGGIWFSDMTQAFGKLPLSFEWSGVTAACASAHKIGGPKGVGCLIAKRGTQIDPILKGGGQEIGRRAGTENVIGIAGFGAAAEAAAQDLADGVWDKVAKLRNILEKSLEQAGKPIVFVGKDAPRLPNTTCFIAPGWKGEAQVMQMDLAGFAVSAGSACSSGKVKESRVLRAMGFDADMARCALRVSFGPTNTEAEVEAFAKTWLAAYDRFLARAAT